MLKSLMILPAVALLLAPAALPAEALSLSVGGGWDRAGCGNAGACILPGANPNDYWHVPRKECYPPSNAYRFASWRIKHNRCFSAEDFYSGAALLPGNLTEWYGNAYDGF